MPTDPDPDSDPAPGADTGRDTTAADTDTGGGRTQHTTITGVINAYLDAVATPPADTDTSTATDDARHCGSYRRKAGTVLEQFREWLRAEHPGADHVEDVGAEVLRGYAQHLRDRARAPDEEFSARTAQDYYAIVRAALRHAVRDGVLTENPARRSRAAEPLPDDTSDDTQQFWRREDVDALLSETTRRVDAALDAHDTIRQRGVVKAMRDRAVVAVLAFTGARGAEVFRSSDDARDGRRGVTWQRVTLPGSDDAESPVRAESESAGSMRVLGKSQEWESAPLPPRAARVLQRYKTALAPSSDAWPVFPSLHRPSLYDAARSALETKGVTTSHEQDDRIDAAGGPLAVLRNLDGEAAAPPALTITGARSVMQRLSDAVETEPPGDAEYYQLHGARRGLGEQLYRENAELAQEALRHRDISVTHDAYSHVEAEETASEIAAVLNDTAGNTAGTSSE